MCIGTKIWCMCSTLHICKRAHRLEYQSGTFCSFTVAQHSGFPSWFCLIRRVTCWQTRHRHHVHWCHLKISPKNSEIYNARSTLSIGNCGCIFFPRPTQSNAKENCSTWSLAYKRCPWSIVHFAFSSSANLLHLLCGGPARFSRGDVTAAIADVQSLLFETCGNAYRISPNSYLCNTRPGKTHSCSKGIIKNICWTSD